MHTTKKKKNHDLNFSDDNGGGVVVICADIDGHSYAGNAWQPVNVKRSWNDLIWRVWSRVWLGKSEPREDEC